MTFLLASSSKRASSSSKLLLCSTICLAILFHLLGIYVLQNISLHQIRHIQSFSSSASSRQLHNSLFKLSSKTLSLSLHTLESKEKIKEEVSPFSFLPDKIPPIAQVSLSNSLSEVALITEHSLTHFPSPPVIQSPSIEKSMLFSTLSPDNLRTLLPSSPMTFSTSLLSLHPPSPLPFQVQEIERGFSPTGLSEDNPLFNVRCQHFFRAREDRYFFRIELFPKKDFTSQAIGQTFFFLIDRSSSLSSRHFTEIKRAIAQVLPLLDSHDFFSILFFDRQVIKFSTQPVQASKENIQNALSFLEKIKKRKFFSSKQLGNTLSNLLSESISKDRLHYLLLFSDGYSFSSRKREREMIRQWTEKNEGSLSLYSFAMGRENNLPLLYALSMLNRGTLFHLHRKGNLQSLLEKFFRKIRRPTVKNIHLHVLPIAKGQGLSLYPSSLQLPPLYAGAPYILYASSNRKENFLLFFQGENQAGWVDGKQLISLSESVSGREEIAHQSIRYEAEEWYAQHLLNQDLSSLDRAYCVLKPFGFKLPFYH